MDIIEKDDFDEADADGLIPESESPAGQKLMSQEEVDKVLKKMDQPVESLKEMAAKIKIFLDSRMKDEYEGKGYLSDYTRRWVVVYNDLMDRIEKALHGEKSVHLHLGKITHAHISGLMRKYKNVTPKKEQPSGGSDSGDEETDGTEV